jgi:hydrogenase expression/formation protein HypC
MKVIKIDGEDGLVKSGSLTKPVKLSLMRGLKKGDYVLVHAGFAIEKVKEREAKRTLRLLKEL